MEELEFREKILKDDSIAYDVIDPDGSYSYGRIKFDEGFKGYIFSFTSSVKIPAKYLREIANFIDEIR